MKSWKAQALLAVVAFGMVTVAGMATAAEPGTTRARSSVPLATQSPMAMQTPMPVASASMTAQDWQMYYHYPYTYYPHNYYGPEYFKSNPYSMMKRYPPEMQIPKYRRDWVNFYPQPKKYYQGYGFKLDIF